MQNNSFAMSKNIRTIILALAVIAFVGAKFFKFTTNGKDAGLASDAEQEQFVSQTASQDGDASGEKTAGKGKQSDKEIIMPAKLKDRPEQILRKQTFTVSYNKSTLCPNWVAWKLTKAHTYGKLPRPEQAFHEDPDVPQPRAQFYDYKSKQYGRGHMCPAGDNKWDQDAIYETFVMSNICPQDRDLNEGVWDQIEITCRQWARRYGELYIVCGPIFKSKNPKTIGTHKVAVPDAFFKVVLRLKPTAQAIGFLCDNQPLTGSMNDYIVSVDEVEKVTGINFFARLDQQTQDEVEANDNFQLW